MNNKTNKNNDAEQYERAIEEYERNSDAASRGGDRRRSKHRPTDPRSAGMTKRTSRTLFAYERFKSQVRWDHPDWDEAQVAAEVDRLMQEFERQHPGVVKQYDLLAPTCIAPRRDHVIRKVEIAAMRQVDEVRELEAELDNTPGMRQGATQLPIAVLEQAIFGRGIPEIKPTVQDFLGSDGLLDWAFDHPADGATTLTPAGVGKNLHKILDENDPEILVRLNLSVIKRLASRRGNDRMGRYCVIDGTSIEANVLQVAGYSPEEEKRLSRKTEAGFVEHSHVGGRKKWWRGYTLLTITDMKSTLPLVWLLVPAQPKVDSVREIIELLFKHWPECPIKYLVGDSEFDVRAINEFLLAEYGIEGVFAQRNNLGAHIHAHYVGGNPICRCNGTPMELTHREGFAQLFNRGPGGTPRGQRVSLKPARLRWRCSDCEDTTTTYPHRHPRVFTYLPRAGENKWAHLRRAMMFRRNCVESIYSQLKGLGIGLRGNAKVKWISTRREMDWVTGGTLFSISLRRLVALNGMYDRALNAAGSKGLVRCAGDDSIANDTDDRGKRAA